MGSAGGTTCWQQCPRLLTAQRDVNTGLPTSSTATHTSTAALWPIAAAAAAITACQRVVIYIQTAQTTVIILA